MRAARAQVDAAEMPQCSARATRVQCEGGQVQIVVYQRPVDAAVARLSAEPARLMYQGKKPCRTFAGPREEWRTPPRTRRDMGEVAERSTHAVSAPGCKTQRQGAKGSGGRPSFGDRDRSKCRARGLDARRSSLHAATCLTEWGRGASVRAPTKASERQKRQSAREASERQVMRWTQSAHGRRM